MVPQPLWELLLMVWPPPRSLAATSRITRLFSFPEGTKMVQFPSFASLKIFILFRITLMSRVAPFGHRRVKAFLAARRHFSQPDTSFFASWYLGILRTPLVSLMRNITHLTSLLTDVLPFGFMLRQNHKKFRYVYQNTRLNFLLFFLAWISKFNTSR